MPRNHGKFKEAEAVPHVLVPRYRQGESLAPPSLAPPQSNRLLPIRLQVKKKMLYSSSFDALKKALVGVQKYIQATDLSEASRESVEEKLRATDRQ